MTEQDKKDLIAACVELLSGTLGTMEPRAADNVVRIVADILSVVNRSK